MCPNISVFCTSSLLYSDVLSCVALSVDCYLLSAVFCDVFVRNKTEAGLLETEKKAASFRVTNVLFFFPTQAEPLRNLSM